MLPTDLATRTRQEHLDHHAALHTVYNRDYDAKSGGLVGDGETDDATALLALIVTVAAAGGGVIRFPPGTYKINSPIEVDGTVVLCGSGKGNTTLNFSALASGSAITLLTERRAVVSDMMLIGPGVASEVIGITLAHAPDLDRLLIYGFGTGIYSYDMCGVSLPESVELYLCGIGVALMHASNQCYIRCRFFYCVNALFVESSHVIVSAWFEVNSGTEIILNGADNVSIERSWIEGNHASPSIKCIDRSAGYLQLINISITDTYFANNDSHAVAIEADHVRLMNVARNSFGALTHTILINDQVSELTATGNEVRGDDGLTDRGFDDVMIVTGMRSTQASIVALSSDAAGNLVADPVFASLDTTAEGTVAPTVALEDGSLRIDFPASQAGYAGSRARVAHGFSVTSGAWYTMSFRVKTDAPNRLLVCVPIAAALSDYPAGWIEASTDWRQFSFTWLAAETATHEFVFYLAAAPDDAVTYWIDDLCVLLGVLLA